MNLSRDPAKIALEACSRTSISKCSVLLVLDTLRIVSYETDIYSVGFDNFFSKCTTSTLELVRLGFSLEKMKFTIVLGVPRGTQGT